MHWWITKKEPRNESNFRQEKLVHSRDGWKGLREMDRRQDGHVVPSGGSRIEMY